jgi:hypothetical protein
MAWLRAARCSVAMAKRAYPVIFVFAIFATLLVATIAPIRDLAPDLGHYKSTL